MEQSVFETFCLEKNELVYPGIVAAYSPLHFLIPASFSPPEVRTVAR